MQPTASTDNSTIMPERLRSNSYDFSHTKRMRTGSISGRLRTASDLEELGYIDKRQKGLIKDLIISGDKQVQDVLDRYANGEKEEVLELLKQDFLGHKESIDLLDGLDFDFINGLREDDDVLPSDGFENHLSSHEHPVLMHRQSFGGSGDGEHEALMVHKSRRDSIDNLFTNDLINLDEYGVGQGGHPILLGGHEDGGILDHDELFNTFAKEDDELQRYHQSHRSNSMGSMTSATSPHNRNMKKSLRIPQSSTSPGYDDGQDVDLSAYANYAAQLQRENQQVGSVGAAGLAAKKRSPGASPGGVHDETNKLLLKIKPSTNNVAHIPTIGNPYAATTIPTTTSASEKMNKFGLRNTASSSSATLATTIGGSALKIPTVANTTGYAPAVAVTIGGALKPINVPTDSMMLSSSSSSGLTGPHPIISSLGDHRHGGNASISSTNLVNDLLHNQHIPRPTGYIGAYSPEQRRLRIEKFLEKRAKRVWTRKVKYDVRKNFADSRLRIKGRFVKKEDEDIMRELMSI